MDFSGTVTVCKRRQNIDELNHDLALRCRQRRRVMARLDEIITMNRILRLTLAVGGVCCLAVMATIWNGNRNTDCSFAAVSSRVVIDQAPAQTDRDESEQTPASSAADLFSQAARRGLEMLASTDPSNQSRAFRELWPDLVRINPRAAAEYLQSPAVMAWRNDLMPVVAQTWAEVDADGAEEWAAGLASPIERNMMLGCISFAVANSDPVRAARVIENPQLNPDRREIIVANLAQRLAGQDLQPLYQQVSKLPAGEERDNLVRWIALSHSQADPAQAATEITEKMGAGPIQCDTTIQILRQWARKDMAAAVSWANQFPSGEVRDKAMEVLSGELYGAYIPESGLR